MQSYKAIYIIQSHNAIFTIQWKLALLANNNHHPTLRRHSCIHPSNISSSYIQRCTARYALSFSAYSSASQFCPRREQQVATRNWPSGRSPACSTLSRPTPPNGSARKTLKRKSTSQKACTLQNSPENPPPPPSALRRLCKKTL